MNGDRDHVSTAIYKYLGGTGRGADPVPPEIALDHPYRGWPCCGSARPRA